jgi:hypothetical protein
MRPVTKGDPPNYPFHDEAAERALANAVTFDANSAVAIVYSRVIRKKQGPAITLKLSEIMGDLLDVTIKGGDFDNPQEKYVGRALENLKEALTRRYRGTGGINPGANPDLVAMIGNACSFCEQPLPNTYLDVEHRAAKSPYPTFYLWWWNFLLACTSCNSTKRDDPQRVTTIAWAGGGNPSENDLVEQIKTHYYWPDLNAGTFRAFRFQYQYDTDTIAPVDMGQAEYSSRDNVLWTHVGNTVTANVYQNGGMHNKVEVQCQMAPGANQKKIDTLKLTGLQKNDTERVALRTKAWLATCAQLKRIFDSVARVANVDKDAQFKDGWDALLVIARALGFYSTHLDILEETAFPAGVTSGAYANLGARFAHDTDPANNNDPLQTIPGTDYSQVP